MGLKDCRGMPVSTDSRVSLQRFEGAVELFHGYYGDPLGAIDAALREDPSFVMGHCLRAAMLLTSGEKAVEGEVRASIEAGERLAANERERAHLSAAREWVEGRLEQAVNRYGAILLDYPRDTLALQAAHLGDFYLGQSSMLRDRVAQVLPHWSEHVPGYGYVLGMYAFGLEETALYGQAEQTGRHALMLNARDPWAVHAVAHVMEMQGRVDEGIEWLNSRAHDWAPDNAFAFHNWWHLALYHLDRGETSRVLELYDVAIRPADSNVVLELIDATAMLWRLHLRGIDVGSRWHKLADIWDGRVEEGYYAFNDAHAMMAFTATGRAHSAQTLLQVMERRAGEAGTNGRMTAEVGLPLCRALQAFGNGDYAVAIEILQPLRLIAQRFGGSHAQRDVLHLTLTEAALRAGRLTLARALLAERTAVKPASTWNWRWTSRALELLGESEAAQRALERAEVRRGRHYQPLASAA